jgi:hypothetical protein
MRIVTAVIMALVLATSAWAAIYSDMTGHPAQRAVERLTAKGVFKPGPDGRFNPTERVTRLDVALFIARLLGISGQGMKVVPFKDQDQIPEDARPAVSAVVGLGTFQANKVEVKRGTIVYTLSTDKAAYGPQDEILLTFTIQNTGKEDIGFDYPTSQFHDFIIRMADGTEVARWSLGRAFLPVDKPVPIAAGKSMTFQTRWRQLDQNDQPVAAGRYEIAAQHTTKSNPVSLSLVYQRGLMSAFPDNTFKPRQPLTRAELAALVVRAGGLEPEAVKAKPPAVSDLREIAEDQRGSVAVVLERKMMAAVSGAFKPAQPATRAEAALALDALGTSLNKYDFTKATFRTVIGSRPPLLSVEDEKKAIRVFRVSMSHAVYRNDRPATIQELKPGDGLQFLKAGDVGDVMYIEATGSEVCHEVLSRYRQPR